VRKGEIAFSSDLAYVSLIRSSERIAQEDYELLWNKENVSHVSISSMEVYCRCM